MKKTNSAFTLIELLVVITIIAILASIALPVFNGVTERANQTKDLSNAKQVGVALKLFASDNNGFFPSKAPGLDYNGAPDTLPTLSNDAFWWLFPNYLQSEDVFTVASSKWTPKNPDNKIDAATSGSRVDTLKAGENTYAYVAGSDRHFQSGLSARWQMVSALASRLTTPTSQTKVAFGPRKKRSSFSLMRVAKS